MLTVIKVGFGLEWEYAVSVRDGAVQSMPIIGPRDGLKYLQRKCSIKSGAAYWAAVDACTAALLLEGSLEDARTRFIIAYAEYMVRLRP
jgi:hypothetical protein